MLVVKTVEESDPAVRANVIEALAGAGGPIGVHSCTQHDERIIVTFDADLTSPEVIDDLITIERTFVPNTVAIDDETAARLASVGLGDPNLDIERILDVHLERDDA